MDVHARHSTTKQGVCHLSRWDPFVHVNRGPESRLRGRPPAAGPRWWPLPRLPLASGGNRSEIDASNQAGAGECRDRSRRIGIGACGSLGAGPDPSRDRPGPHALLPKLHEFWTPLFSAVIHRRNCHGDEIKAHSKTEARTLLAAGLAAGGINTRDLPHLPKSDPRKVMSAAQIRRSTAVSPAWITAHLQMGPPCNVSPACRRRSEPEVRTSSPDCRLYFSFRASRSPR